MEDVMIYLTPICDAAWIGHLQGNPHVPQYKTCFHSDTRNCKACPCRCGIKYEW